MLAEKIEFNSIQSLLDYRIEKPTVLRTRHKHKEAAFCDRLDKALPEILSDIGYKVTGVKREFELDIGRIDYLCKLEDEKYLIVEVKVENESNNKDLTFSFALGQLLTYRTLLAKQYQIKKQNIELILLTDVDSITTLAVIDAEDINVNMLVVGENGVKFYGKNRQTTEGN